MTEAEEVYETIGWENDRVRCQLYRAEVASRMGDTANTRNSLDSAARWVLHSGSMEHLCLYHLVRSRIARKAQDIRVAELAVDEGLHIARQCGLGLYHVELLCVRAESLLDTEQAVDAERSAREAIGLASASDCQFAWGCAEAGHLLGRSLNAQGRSEEAKSLLEEILSLRISIGDFRAEQTKALIRTIRDSSDSVGD
jgi:hypothetical protein